MRQLLNRRLHHTVTRFVCIRVRNYGGADLGVNPYQAERDVRICAMDLGLRGGVLAPSREKDFSRGRRMAGAVIK
ncbi:protein of unknown function [Cupriavidus taiwanensis]|nr:protein of unknown function [Cupriavidus taiwanensis]